MRRKLLFWTAAICFAAGMHLPDGRLLQAFAVFAASLWLTWWLHGKDRPAAARGGGDRPPAKAAKGS